MKKKKIKLLWVSYAAPYNAVRHAGGQTHNYYIKGFAKDRDFQVRLLAYCNTISEAEIVERECNEAAVDTDLIVHPESFVGKLFWRMINIETRLNPFNRYAGLTRNHLEFRIKHKIEQLLKDGYQPDVVILEWTQVNLLAKQIKAYFPNAKIIASEHDVSFLSAKRKALIAQGYKKIISKYRYQRLKKIEVRALHYCNLILVQNLKDRDLLLEQGFELNKLHVICPHYHDMRRIVRSSTPCHDILFWGAMSRPENYEAALWFIDYVMPYFKDTDVRFVVAGNKPPEILQNKASDKVIITGFIDDETEYFVNSLCIVVPLIIGAGIKVKVIEALSAGIPILTNEIGIEGIPAKSGKSYFHCEKSEEYKTIIKRLLEGEIDLTYIEKEQRDVVEKFFNMEQSKNAYIEKVKERMRHGDETRVNSGEFV